MTESVKKFNRTKGGKPRQFQLDDELFHAIRYAPGGTVLDLMSGSVTDEQQAAMTPSELQELSQQSLEKIVAFFDTVIVPNDKARWNEAIREVSAEGGVLELSELMAIAQWLSEEYAANPTGGSSLPTSGGGAPAPASSGGQRSGAATYSRPPRKSRSQ